MSDNSDNVYAVTEIVGSSSSSTDDAVRNAIATANQWHKNLDWFEITETRGHIENGEIGHFQVVLKIGFRHEKGT